MTVNRRYPTDLGTFSLEIKSTEAMLPEQWEAYRQFLNTEVDQTWQFRHAQVFEKRESSRGAVLWLEDNGYLTPVVWGALVPCQDENRTNLSLSTWYVPAGYREELTEVALLQLEEVYIVAVLEELRRAYRKEGLTGHSYLFIKPRVAFSVEAIARLKGNHRFFEADLLQSGTWGAQLP